MLLSALRWTAEARLAADDAKAFEAAMRDLDEWVDTSKGTAADARLRATRFKLRGQPGASGRAEIVGPGVATMFKMTALRNSVETVFASPNEVSTPAGLALGSLSTFLASKAGKKCANDDLKDLRGLKKDLFAELGWDFLASAEAKKLLDDVPGEGTSF